MRERPARLPRRDVLSRQPVDLRGEPVGAQGRWAADLLGAAGLRAVGRVDGGVVAVVGAMDVEDVRVERAARLHVSAARENQPSEQANKQQAALAQRDIGRKEPRT